MSEEDEKFKPIEEETKNQTLATILGAQTSPTSNQNLKGYSPVLIGMIRRAIPNLIAFDVCGVQPLSAPTGLIFALKEKYSGSKEKIEASDPNRMMPGDISMKTLKEKWISPVFDEEELNF